MPGDLTPMMRQYAEIKQQYKDCILFYRLGDFYEMFFDDAKLASKELELVLTGRECGQAERAPMCGVPYHSCESYIARLVAKGYKVAICEQMEDPKEAKGLVKREVTRLITPGTVLESSMLEETRNNYIASVYLTQREAGLCFADISTGEISAAGFAGKGWIRRVAAELGRFSPAEVIGNRNLDESREIGDFLRDKLGLAPGIQGEEVFASNRCKATVEAQFGKTLDELTLASSPVVVAAVGGLLHYLHETQKNNLSYIKTLNLYRAGQFMELDASASKNLELLETLRGREKRGSLLWVLDQTKTAMGGRLMRQWVEQPLTDVPAIQRRQAAVGELMDNMVARCELTIALKGVFDIERLIGRVVYGTASAKDLRTLSDTAKRIPPVAELTGQLTSPMMRELTANLDPLSDLVGEIDQALVEDPPFSLKEGGLIRDGYNAELDNYRGLLSGGHGALSAIEERERERTGIKGLKIGYNKVFGYYIEVTKSYYSLVPADYIRKQTLAGCERYITEELKQLETQVLTAGDRANRLEYDLFVKLREKVSVSFDRVQRVSRALAVIDVLNALADLGATGRYVLPEVDLSDKLEIKDGRHPVVERVLRSDMFVPNDALLDCGDNRMIILTGPNMAGKSTFMRQVALIVIMAQMGAPVPAASAHIGVCDRVFTRVGASDDLTAGQSTFMVEMSEVAAILKYATRKSLLILDEIGRGTSTFDGMAIARAVLVYCADQKLLGAKTLFATHYHELTTLEGRVEGVKNYNIAVKKRGDDITFLRKIIRGCADDSYGIEVAKLAGIPARVIEQAKKILKELEAEAPASLLPPPQEPSPEEEGQVSLAEMEAARLVEELKQMDLNTLTPIEAMNALFRLKKQAEKI